MNLNRSMIIAPLILFINYLTLLEAGHQTMLHRVALEDTIGANRNCHTCRENLPPNLPRGRKKQEGGHTMKPRGKDLK